jgi:hypothetical protein
MHATDPVLTTDVPLLTRSLGKSRDLLRLDSVQVVSPGTRRYDLGSGVTVIGLDRLVPEGPQPSGTRRLVVVLTLVPCDGPAPLQSDIDNPSDERWRIRGWYYGVLGVPNRSQRFMV